MDILLHCRKFEVVRTRVPDSDGRSHEREFVLHPGAVVVLPLLDDRRVIMIDQYRPAIGRRLLELPAGTLDVPDEPAEACARRELAEETGYRADQMEALCELYPSPGILTERIQAFVATGLQSGAAHPEPTEDIRVVPLAIEEAIIRIGRGEIVDAKSMVALMYYRLRSEGRG